MLDAEYQWSLESKNWNSLSLSTRSADTIGTSKSQLKTDLFTSAYITYRSIDTDTVHVCICTEYQWT